METIIYQADINNALNLLKNFLDKQSPADALVWLENKKKQIFSEKTDSLFFMTYSTLSNYFDKELLTLNEDELQRAHAIRHHWRPNNWSLAQTARAYLILSFALHRPEHFKDALDKIFGAADIYELIALYQALPLFPYPEEFLLRATDGIRSNMLSVFESIALNNPYPADYFNETAWNQLVLKTIFVESPVQQIIGLKRRANPELARALINTARERLSAGRPIKLELWCLVGLSADKKIESLLKNLIEEQNPLLQRGALLACDHCRSPEAKALLKKHAEKFKTIQDDLNKLRAFERELV